MNKTFRHPIRDKFRVLPLLSCMTTISINHRQTSGCKTILLENACWMMILGLIILTGLHCRLSNFNIMSINQLWQKSRSVHSVTWNLPIEPQSCLLLWNNPISIQIYIYYRNIKCLLLPKSILPTLSLETESVFVSVRHQTFLYVVDEAVI